MPLHLAAESWFVRRALRYLILFSFVFSISLVSLAQRPFYAILVTLDTAQHTLSGTMDISYTNRSTISMDKLAIHLWPNAYSRKNTAMGRQMLRQGRIEFHNARKEQLGGFDKLRFEAPDQPVFFSIDTNHLDIGWLNLTEPLLPGASIKIHCDFVLKIPQSFSRLGRAGNTYQLTQWFPHLAVHNEQGWNPMPYLDSGEYFNDFADFEVEVHTPPDYIVAATGVMTHARQEEKKTVWTFSAQQVIDFAWFASPTFRHDWYTVGLPEGHTTELHVYTDTAYQHVWQRASVYAERALRFYSDWLGTYPYPRMSIVHTPGSRAGFMEYPMLAQISHTGDTALLDLAIAHEIGHTWLYGILANDERAHPWLDEGLNTFLEAQYMALFQPSYRDQFLPEILDSRISMSQSAAMLHFMRRQGTLQPPATLPEFQSGEQYAMSAYHLPSLGLVMMQEMLGAEKMKRMYRDYFDAHAFTHVTPELLRQSFEGSCECDLGWFFDQWIHHAHKNDYRASRLRPSKKEVTLENHGEVMVPLKLSTFKKGTKVRDHWIPAFVGRKIIHLDFKADAIRLYEGLEGVNTLWGRQVLPRPFFPRFSLIPKVGSYGVWQVSATPFFGNNVTDGLMPGLAVMSGIFPQQRLKFLLAPMYGLESKSLRGVGEFRYIGDLQGRSFDKLLLSFSASRFGYNVDTHYQFRDSYTRLSPALALRFKPSLRSPLIHQWLSYRYVHIGQEYGRGINYDQYVFTMDSRTYGVHELAFHRRSDHALRPYSARANVQAGQGFVRLNLHYRQHFVGKDRMRGIWVHGYGGWLPVFDQPAANTILSINGMASSGFFARDYMFDEWLGGRNAVSGLFSRQVFMRDAGLKTLSTIGIGDQWMFGGGASSALPFKVIHFYLDAAVYPSIITQTTQLSYSGGVSVVLMKDVFEVFIPFLESRDIRESLSYVIRDRWFERISFMANFKLFHPLNLMDGLQFRY